MLLSSYFAPSREPIMGFRDLATGRVHHDNCRPTVQSAPWSRCCTATSSQSATRARTSTRPATNREDTAMTTHTTTGTHPGTDLHVDTWGDGTPVVLAHGSLATAAEEWEAQRPLAGKGFRFLAPDRRGYGRSPAATGEDFLRDAEDIAALMGDGAHLVGHSYGGLGVLFAAARRPEATLSLALLEPAAFALGQHHPAGRALLDQVRRMWDQDAPDEQWVTGFLKAVGSDPDEFPPTSSPPRCRSCRCFAAGDRFGTRTCRSRSSRRRRSRSSSCPAGTAPDSTPSATTSQSASAPPAR